MDMFRIGGLKEKLLDLNQTVQGVRRVKVCLGDGIYHSKKHDLREDELFSIPNRYDSKELNNFKSRGRLRHETLNARLKFFNALGLPFRHGFNDHKFVFEAIVVIVQYQMDNGSPIFAV